MSPAEWDALPWWQQRMYVEKLNEEFGGNSSSTASKDGPDVVYGAPGPGQFAATGIKEQWL